MSEKSQNKVVTLTLGHPVAIEQVARSFSANDLRLAPGQLPTKLFGEIEAYHAENGNE